MSDSEASGRGQRSEEEEVTLRDSRLGRNGLEELANAQKMSWAGYEPRREKERSGGEGEKGSEGSVRTPQRRDKEAMGEIRGIHNAGCVRV